MQERLIFLIDKMQQKELSYFSEFYELTKRSVFYNILSLTRNETLAEDLMQDSYVKFLHNIEKVDKTKSILGYLIMISRNLTLDYFKKNNRVVELDDNDYRENIHHHDSHDAMDMKILLSRISKILNKHEYEVFTLHVLSELTFQEIALELKKPLGSILYTYNASIKKIRKEISYEEFAR